MDNRSVKLADYGTAFAHNESYFLLGWDTRRDCVDLIPEFTGDQTIGVDMSTASANVLYAVWEPQVMIRFENKTGYRIEDIHFEVPAWAEGELFRVNTVTGAYGREKFEKFSKGQATFDLEADETLCLVLPDSADMDFSVNGVNGLEPGNRLIVTRKSAVSGEEDDVSMAYVEDPYLVTGTMKISETPVEVIFTKEDYDLTADIRVRYFLYESNGTVKEITNYDQNTSSWRSSGYKTSLELTAGTTDLAAALQFNDSTGVSGYLSETELADHGHTTIGVGAAEGDFNEFRASANDKSSGGPKVRFVKEKVEWVQGDDGIPYDNAAIYVVFYELIPVPITVTKSVVGTDADKSVQFPFTANIKEHSKVFTYTVKTPYTAKRTLVEHYEQVGGSYYWVEYNGSVGGSSTTGWDPSEGTPGTPETSLLSEIESEMDKYTIRQPSDGSWELSDAKSHEVTLFYDESSASDTDKTPGSASSGSYQYHNGILDYWHNSQGSRTYRRTTQTTNWTETVTYTVTYRYETVEISETPTDNFELTYIATTNGQVDKVDGTPQKYTISSWNSDSYTVQDADNVVFTNTRTSADLTVTKNVVDGDVNDEFGFLVTLNESLVGFSSDGVKVSADGKHLSFSLKHGGFRKLTLPVGIKYSVSENADARYAVKIDPATVTLSVGDDEAATLSGDVTVTVTNTRKTDLAVVVKNKVVDYNGSEQYGYTISSVTGTGSEVSTDDYKVTGLKEGDVLTVTGYVAAQGTDADEYGGSFANAIITVTRTVDGETKDVTAEYNITEKTPGKLTINKVAFTVTINGVERTKTYNGSYQEVTGYEYTIAGEDGADISGAGIRVTIPLDDQKVGGLNVGEYSKEFEASKVAVTYNETNYELLEVVIGSPLKLTITPAVVTVTADDKEKIYGCSDPALTATVTGLFGDDKFDDYTLSCTKDESTEPEKIGASYDITPSGPETLYDGNYTVEYVPGKLTIVAPEVIQRATGNPLYVVVGINDEVLARFESDPDFKKDSMDGDAAASSRVQAVNNYLNKFDDHGVRRWEHFVTGTEWNKPLLTNVAQDGTLKFGLGVDPSNDYLHDLGYKIAYDLQKTTGEKWDDLAKGEPADGLVVPSSLSDALLEKDGAYYRVRAHIVPNETTFDANKEQSRVQEGDEINNVIPTENVAGVIRVESQTESTITSVAFTALPHDPLHPVDGVETRASVANLLGAASLEAGDQIRARYTEDGADVYMIYKKTGSGYDGPEYEKVVDWAVSTNGQTVELPESPSAYLDRGSAVWTTRQEVTADPYYIIGQYSGEDVTVAVAGAVEGETIRASYGSTLVANPSIKPIAINDPRWGWAEISPSADDTLTIPGPNGAQYNLTWKNGKWGRTVLEKKGRVFVPTSYTDDVIPAGTGFWYYRYQGGAGFTLEIKADKLPEE